MTTLARVEKDNLSSRVYQEIRSALMNGQYVPGDRLRISDLAESLGTSPTPVREAIFRLVSEQALQMTAATAITVPELAPETVSEIQFIRRLMEGAAAEIAAHKATPAEIASLRHTHEQFIKYLPTNPREAARLNRDFHFELVAIARLPNLYGILESLWVRMGPLLNIFFHTELQANRKDLQNHAHYRVLSGLEQRDPVGTAEAIREDIQLGETVLLAWMKGQDVNTGKKLGT
ncbi:GntR family transcriptional regulator [Noviherbaspirillum denitrificans]|uniref:GntR family transcriptional regulator n=1 Tax=Noviherbaspirillum denitrificans TaxID=1968433 RepID=A0A254TRQ9_9BURK|nr:GntR family transcriptional regulator [Noviherbaspirillum denitrificans]OWW22408.1 GntR family transcriptional regulator [Noviherbaspirillum denitrificans]